MLWWPYWLTWLSGRSHSETVVLELWTGTDGSNPHGPIFYSVDRHYFFECISPSVQMHYAKTILSLAAVLQLLYECKGRGRSLQMAATSQMKVSSIQSVTSCVKSTSTCVRPTFVSVQRGFRQCLLSLSNQSLI
jgi:hypothetical protein